MGSAMAQGAGWSAPRVTETRRWTAAFEPDLGRLPWGVDAESASSLSAASVRTLPAFHGVGDESLDEVFELTLGVGCEDRFESFCGSGCSLPELGEVLDVGVDVTSMPGVEDGFHIGEVFVEGGAADPAAQARGRNPTIGSDAKVAMGSSSELSGTAAPIAGSTLGTSFISHGWRRENTRATSVLSSDVKKRCLGT